MLTLKFTERTVYGKTIYYPRCEPAKVICRMADQKTATHQQVHHVLASAFNVEIYSGYDTLLATVTPESRAALLREKNAHTPSPKGWESHGP